MMELYLLNFVRSECSWPFNKIIREKTSKWDIEGNEAYACKKINNDGNPTYVIGKPKK